MMVHDWVMTLHVVTSGPHRRPTQALVGSRLEVDLIPGPAALFETEDGLVGTSFEGRPVAACEEGGDWERVPDAVADQWLVLPQEVRARLIVDPRAPLPADEFRAVTRAGASVTAVYWVESEDSAGFRASGDLGRFVRVLSAVNG